MNFNFTGKTVLVIGASTGIGFCIAHKFSQEGAKVIISSSNNKKLSSAFNQLKSNQNADIVKITCDVKNTDDVSSLCESILSNSSHVDYVINAAGIYPPTSILKTPSDEWDEIININLKGTANVLQCFSPHMTDRMSGKFVIISSITGTVVGNSIFPHYSASKAGINGLVKSAAIELAKYKVYINSIAPGNILTSSLNYIKDEYIESHKKAIPLSRLGTPDDIANVALFLASPLSDFITGQNIIVDGGQTLPESHFLP